MHNIIECQSLEPDRIEKQTIYIVIQHFNKVIHSCE